MTVDAFFPVKDAGIWLPRFLGEVDKLDVDRVVVTYGASMDDTLEILKKWKDETPHEVEAYSDPHMTNALTSALIADIYRDYQKLVAENSSCTHALLLDSDLLKMPKDMVQKLVNHKKNIISPYPYVYLHDKPCRLFYDTFCFRLNKHRFHPFKPPRNNGRLIQLDSVGTCMLVERKPFTETPYGNPYPHMKFCDESRAKGYEVWGDPSTIVWHLDVVRMGLPPHAQIEVLEAQRRGHPDPMSQASQVPYIRDDGSTVDAVNIMYDVINTYVYGKP